MASFNDGSKSRFQRFRTRFGKFFQDSTAEASKGTQAIVRAFTNFIDKFGGNRQTLISSARQRLRLSNTASTQILKDKAISLIQAQTQKHIQETLERYAKGRIDSDQFRQSMRQIITRSSLASAIVGVGGFGNLTENVLSAVRKQISKQFEYLDGFISDIQNRNLTQRDRARATMYANSVHSISQTAARQFRLDMQQELGLEIQKERRVTSAGENCEDCLAMEAEGCQPIGTLPAIGQESVCGTNCKCRFVYDCDERYLGREDNPISEGR